MAAREFGGLLTIDNTTPATAESLTALLRKLHGAGHRPMSFSNALFHAHFNNTDRIYIVFEIDGTKYDVDPIIPDETVEVKLTQGMLSSDGIFFRAATASDQMYVAGLES